LTVVASLTSGNALTSRDIHHYQMMTTSPRSTGHQSEMTTDHITHTHTHPFNGPLSGTTQVSRYQKSKTNLDFTGARDSERQWYQLGHMQVCTLLQTDDHASTPPLSFFTGRMPFLPPKQQCQSTEGKSYIEIEIIESSKLEIISNRPIISLQ